MIGYFSLNIWKNNLEFIISYTEFKSYFENTFYAHDSKEREITFSPFYGLRNETFLNRLIYCFRYDIVKKLSCNNTYLDNNYLIKTLNSNISKIFISNIISFVVFSVLPIVYFLFSSVKVYYTDNSSVWYNLSILYIIFSFCVEIFILIYFIKWKNSPEGVFMAPGLYGKRKST